MRWMAEGFCGEWHKKVLDTQRGMCFLWLRKEGSVYFPLFPWKRQMDDGGQTAARLLWTGWLEWSSLICHSASLTLPNLPIPPSILPSHEPPRSGLLLECLSLELKPAKTFTKQPEHLGMLPAITVKRHIGFDASQKYLTSTMSNV